MSDDNCNAKKELLAAIASAQKKYKTAEVVCADITYEPSFRSIGSKKEIFRLLDGYSDKEWEFFLDRLDFEYDAGYGGQELFGVVWLTNHIWLSRGEYDGSEWWRVNKYPAIPEYLKKGAK